MLKQISYLAVGSVLGCSLRWWVGLKLNAFFPFIPLGTLTANLVAGYGAGIAVAFFAQMPGITLEWEIFLITGFLGGLSTFSTFSIEVVTLFQHERLIWAFGAIIVHVVGSLMMTLAGIATWQWLRSY